MVYFKKIEWIFCLCVFYTQDAQQQGPPDVQGAQDYSAPGRRGFHA